mmetsp:Transcript_56132/g.93362  ORF Transcript_56132/g.93362 Transcript_56132/m.93362 type:complete len:97 (+) Transcript_56132:319-609(+)|eukprot:CAMPEP_0184649826 /NCGR_PEP_ID=MMETSP0308-20130426/7251_1 /TAXON_ID=38269 /ORGANISM="Gloeochaete witrockiana, Strain SAG 46.84" /LENGTH=96 /DNA_ID=CAMNT_0027082859 /DNA_START=333 /DNA_END=623 /DNA_ORIENTATION=-
MRFYAAATGTGSKVVSLTSMEKASWRADEKRRKVGGEAPFARSMNRYYATATGTGKQRGLSALTQNELPPKAQVPTITKDRIQGGRNQRDNIRRTA